MPSRKREREYKSLPVHIVNVDEVQGIVEAVVSVFGNIDDGKDIVHPGSFTKTITERANRIKVVDQHNMLSTRDVVGKPLEMRELARAELPAQILEKYPEATGGLYVKMQFALETSAGSECFALVKGGFIDEYSFGFEVIQSDYTRVERAGREDTVRNIREVKLWEVSPVIWGMNPATATVGVKNRKDYGPDGSHRKLLGDVLKAGVHSKFNYIAAMFYSEGYLSADEYAEMITLGTDLFNLLQERVSDDVANREYQEYYYWSNDEAAPEQKQSTSAEPATPAGPSADESKADEVDDEPPQEETPTLDEKKLLDEIEAGLAEIDLQEAS